MALPEREILQKYLSPHHERLIFERVAEWGGAKVGHYRVLPGSIVNRSTDEHLIVVPLKGSFVVDMPQTSGARMQASRTVGHTSIVPAGLKYSSHWDEELEDLSIRLNPQRVAREFPEFELNEELELVNQCGASDPLIFQIALLLVNEFNNESRAGKLYADSLVQALTVHIVRHYATRRIDIPLNFGGLPKTKLNRVFDYIDENLDQDLTLTEIAQAAELSPYHFARSFKQTTGQTPIQFLMNRRIENAKRMLAETDLPIVEIGLLSGFKNQSHFTTIFRKFTSITPKAYRNVMNSN